MKKTPLETDLAELVEQIESHPLFSALAYASNGLRQWESRTASDSPNVRESWIQDGMLLEKARVVVIMWRNVVCELNGGDQTRALQQAKAALEYCADPDQY